MTSVRIILMMMLIITAVMGCMIRAGQNAAGEEGGALDLITTGTWERFTIDLANDIPRELVQYLQWGGNRVAQNRLRLFVGAAVAAGVGIGINAANAQVPAKLKYVS